MGLIGIIIASVVNIFIGSTALQFAISVIGVLVFAGLTAYDTQQIKEMYYAGDDGTVAGQKAVMGALQALSGLHQHVPDAAAALRQPPLAASRQLKQRGPGVTAGAFRLGNAIPPPRHARPKCRASTNWASGGA